MKHDETWRNMTKHDNTRPRDVKRQIPNAQASAGRPYGFPETNSGGWYAGVPSTVPDMGTVGGKVALEEKWTYQLQTATEHYGTTETVEIYCI